MTDNMNKSIDNEELDLDQLENVSGGAFKPLGAVNALGSANALALGSANALALGSANTLLARKTMNEAGIRSSMNSTPLASTALLLNSDNMLDDKK